MDFTMENDGANTDMQDLTSFPLTNSHAEHSALTMRNAYSMHCQISLTQQMRGAVELQSAAAAEEEIRCSHLFTPEST
jgi:hypothetical protein